MNELGLNQTELAARCDRVAQDMFPDGEQPQISRERIARILMHCKACPGKSAARVISHQEARVLSVVLQVSPEWLFGQEEARDLVLWDPLVDPKRAKHILHLITEHEDKASEILVWAESLMCSLQTPDFMHEHHEAIFTTPDVLGAHDEKRKLVQMYDNLGNDQRKRLLDPKPKHRKLVQFIFESDLEKLARGKAKYAGMRTQVRKACLENLDRIVSEPSLGVELRTINDEDAARVSGVFRDYDWVGVFDSSLVLWRYHSGRSAWSETPAHANKWRRTLSDLRVVSSPERDILRFIRMIT
ncbi:MAG TPA: hypothetical protein VN937_24935 [Blastocatellia bacterium]|nr:hypothetical protein [Blastocatellia bacterium]